jgi:hypothetical protein
MLSVAAQALAALFRVPAVAMLMAEGRVVTLRQVGDIELQEAELEAARAALAAGTAVRGGVYPDLASRFDFWPVPSADGRNAVIGLAFDPGDRPALRDVKGLD